METGIPPEVATDLTNDMTSVSIGKCLRIEIVATTPTLPATVVTLISSHIEIRITRLTEILLAATMLIETVAVTMIRQCGRLVLLLHHNLDKSDLVILQMNLDTMVNSSSNDKIDHLFLTVASTEAGGQITVIRRIGITNRAALATVIITTTHLKTWHEGMVGIIWQIRRSK